MSTIFQILPDPSRTAKMNSEDDPTIQEQLQALREELTNLKQINTTQAQEIQTLKDTVNTRASQNIPETPRQSKRGPVTPAKKEGGSIITKDLKGSRKKKEERNKWVKDNCCGVSKKVIFWIFLDYSRH